VTEVAKIKDAVNKKDCLRGFLAYGRFKAAVNMDVGDWGVEVIFI